MLTKESFGLLPAFITHSDCIRHEMGVGHPECPERLGAIQDALQARGLLDAMSCHDAPLATQEALARAHALPYVQELMAAAPAHGYYQVDPDTCMNPFTMKAALRAAGAAIHATDLVLGGKAASAFCSVRPPGHHAEKASGMGFCFFNNIAVAIRHGLVVHGLERVALIDFDVHHGNGSEDIFRGDPRVLMCSIFQRGLFPFSGEENQASNMVNVALNARASGEELRAAVREKWLPALEAFRPQALFISAGFDAHAQDSLGDLGFQEADYQWMTRELARFAASFCEGRIISCLEGGYHLGALASSVCEHVSVLVEASRLPQTLNSR